MFRLIVGSSKLFYFMDSTIPARRKRDEKAKTVLEEKLKESGDRERYVERFLSFLFLNVHGKN